MTWLHYRLSFRLQSPLRVGARETGNLLSTQPYISGRVFWAALTARITRDRGEGGKNNAYKQVGDELQKHMRFSYLWASYEKTTPFYPWQDQAEFDYLFLNSYVSTALGYPHQSALDGSLHEAEYIAPVTRRGQQVYLLGELWVKDDYSAVDWKKALANIQLGGERRYGWGRVSLTPIPDPDTATDIADPDNFVWGSGRIPAHVSINGLRENMINGRVEPLIGWEMSESGKKRLSPHTIAYAPGASFVENAERPAFCIGEMGIWKMAN